MKPKQAIEVLERMQEINKQLKNDEVVQALDHAINCVGAIEQIKWERDIAIQQLNELGYQFGEKVKPDEHENVKQLRAECEETLNKDYTKICDTVNKMTPKEWVEEMIYKFGNNYCYTKRLYVCDALFILLDKLAEDKE